MTTIWESIERAITSVFRKKDLIEAVEKQELRPYNVLKIDLGTARTNNEFKFKGDTFSVVKLNGEATVRFNEKDNDEYDLTKIQEIIVPFYRFFITNTAQSGKSITISIGREAAVRIVPPPTTPTIDPRFVYDSAVLAVGAGATFTADITGYLENYVFIDKIAATFEDTAAAATYISISVTNLKAQQVVELKRVTAAKPNFEYDPKILIEDLAYAQGRWELRFYNAATTAKNASFLIYGRKVM